MQKVYEVEIDLALLNETRELNGGFGAVRLQSHAQALERACREDRKEDARHLLTEIRSVAQAAIDALESEYDLRSREAMRLG